MQFTRLIIALSFLTGSAFAQTSPQRTQSTTPPRPAPSVGTHSSNQLNPDVLHNMKDSTEDLNALRDGNLTRVQTGGCAPQIAAHIAGLKGRLENYGSVPKPRERPSSTSAAAAAAEAVNRQLDSVLGLSPTETPDVKPSEKPADNDEMHKRAETETALINAELARLTSVCASAK